MKHLQVSGRERRTSFWKLGLSASAAVLLAASLQPAYAQEQRFSFDISPQPLSSALLELGRQANLSVLAPSSLVNGRTAPGVKGDLSANDAFTRLLAGSGLRAEFVNPTAVRIVARDDARLPSRRPAPVATDQASQETERIIVTGTTITGVYPASSPVTIYSADDIARTGATTMEQFIAKVPQNLGTFSQYAAGSTVDAGNPNGVTSADLRGLGVGTTLTLLNGRRLANSNSGQSVDISLIPASAIERVEILTDGASAIYGSDAIGGVVNFVLKKEFEGAETRASMGGVTDGGMKQGGFSQSLGGSWEGGSALIAYNYHSASALERSERDYSASAGEGTLTPNDIRHNVFTTLQHDVTGQLRIGLDAGYAWRKVKNTYTVPFPGFESFSTFNSYASTTRQAFGTLGAVYDISDDLIASVDVAYSRTDVEGERASVYFNQVPTPPPTFSDFSTLGSSLDAVAKLEGALLELPGGTARFSVGAGVLEETFEGISAVTNAQSAGELGRQTLYGFGEVFLPLVSPELEFPFVRQLELSLAARYTDYRDTSEPGIDQDFGSSVDPKVGLLWSPNADLNLRGTYGRSFRAPSLTQLDRTSGAHYIFDMPVDGTPAYVMAMVAYPAPDLKPETAETYTLGFDVEPAAMSGFRLSGTYYSIDYTDRIAAAPTGGLSPFDNTSLLPDVIYRAPSAAFIEEGLRASPLFANLNTSGIDLSDPQAASAALFALPNLWIYDVRLRNLALSKQDGFDVSVSQSFATDWGDVSLAANVTRILDYKQQSSPSAPARTATDIPGAPPDWRGRFSAGWSNGPLQATLGVNYVDDYSNPWVAGNPAVKGWTTVDLNIGYDLRADGASADDGVRLSLSVQNLLDEEPPFLGDGSNQAILAPIGFDPVNANPLGRFILFSVAKKW
jgi:iron complex outermembrane receptor protein